jgi:coproporphyrinogen III oxidase
LARSSTTCGAKRITVSLFLRRRFFSAVSKDEAALWFEGGLKMTDLTPEILAQIRNAREPQIIRTKIAKIKAS